MRFLAFLCALCSCAEARPVNAGANTLIFAGESLPSYDYGGIIESVSGTFRPDPIACEIHLRAPWSRAQGVAIHEYEHYIEWRLRNDHAALVTVRDAFRDLMAPGFELGHDDLMRRLP